MNTTVVPLRGVALAVTATAMFALISPYVTLLSPLSGIDIFAWRMIWTMPFTLLLLGSQKGFGKLLALASELHRQPVKGLTLIACAALLGLQQWLFLWAPLHGRMLEVSLGYFFLPIVMVLVGWLVDRQRIHPLQWLAVAFAAIGVAHEFLYSQAFSWPTLVVALGFPPYFLLRRHFRQDSLTIFAAELSVMLPAACILAFTSESFQVVVQRMDMLTILLPGLGILSAVSFVTYLSASRQLPIALFGLLGYIEPILLVVISTLIFGEEILVQELWTYVPVALSIIATAAYVMRVALKTR
jgi:chloramphenicol-sensitive protein RarD